ncbi:MAG: P1 family peptidase [Planctomycetaceae bacterium]
MLKSNVGGIDGKPVSRRTLMASVAAAGAGLLAEGDTDAAVPQRLTADTDLGAHVLEVDLPGLHIGSAVYRDGPTGCTVFHFPDRARGVADIRGGSPATYWTDALRRGAAPVDAICLTGGSIYGLEAVAGVTSALLQLPGYSTHWERVALVSGAVIYDFGARKSVVYPDRELGVAALQAARPGRFALGGQGAGASASCGKWLGPPVRRELAGQGGACARRGKTRVAVFTVVNSVGAICDRSGRVVRGHFDPRTGRRLPFTDRSGGAAGPSEGNTTLTLVVTNQKLEDWHLSQLARQVHTSMARAIQPFHTLKDGDVLYAVTTDQVGREDDAEGWQRVAELADGCAWDAVLKSFTGRSQKT